MESRKTQCCIVGGGPAGLMLALLLARNGVDVICLEKHSDFLRDFRGDTVHPSTLEILSEIGLLQEFFALSHHKTKKVFVRFADGDVPFIDFSTLRPFDYIAFAAQWDFLDLIAGEASKLPTFHLMMGTTAKDLIRDAGGRVIGVAATSASIGDVDVFSELVVGADGRSSILRRLTNVKLHTLGAPMDVFWFRVSVCSTDPPGSMGVAGTGLILACIHRGSYWQIGMVISKGTAGHWMSQPLKEFRERIATSAPFLADRVDEISSWDKVKLLEVKVDCLEKWFEPGLLFIGDAAHAMSPVGGVGINLAIQDAVATSNILTPTFLSNGIFDEQILAKVQNRRSCPTKIVQRVQLLIQNRVIKRTLKSKPSGPPNCPCLLRVLTKIRCIPRLPARLFGYGIRQEHVLPQYR